MRKTFLLLPLVAVLAACGADGEPERPDRAAPVPGLTVTGNVSVGVAGTL